MPSSHPYSCLQLPTDAPFELRSSVGKGWGVFATRRIARGALILREDPLFIIRKHPAHIIEEDVWRAFQQLLPDQKQQFLLLRDNSVKPFTSMNAACAENSFSLRTPGESKKSKAPAQGLFLLHSRFNHSCLPNAKIPIVEGESIESFAVRDILPGEEITICYEPDFECQTRLERHEVLRFTCDCEVCQPGTLFQQLSDSRRRLIRGLEYLTQGKDLDRQRRDSSSPLIIDPALKRAAETFDISVSSRLIYRLLSVVLLYDEGLLDDIMLQRLWPGISRLAGAFGSEENAVIAQLALEQDTWVKKLEVAFKLFGRRDPVDGAFAKILRLKRGI
ncbi:hypothetical protein C7999DRAFT_41784 [Corynascus novoguineensis]|uniref:SET domain-containing protein n=1 Tax=Corynascus novoguineensis TaxID=1126955 RepID=A0AAN7CRQ2_9PEZI|nr:hypothetical protein C7999DRAFT_41784 [Corynascus novoguineensis]